MSEGTKANYCKEKAKQTYAYLKKYGLVGWGLFEKPERLTALSTFCIFLATAVALGIGIAQWRALHNTDEKIGRQLALLETDHRPWIASPEITIEKSDIPDSVNFILAFKNVGKTPTTGVDTEATIVDQSEWLSTVRGMCENRRDLMQRLRNDVSHYRDFSMVPQSPFIVSHTHIRDKRIAELREMKSPHLIGCVIYGSRFDDIPRKTGFVARIAFEEENVIPLSPYAVEPD